jgi:hypothetical protein
MNVLFRNILCLVIITICSTKISVAQISSISADFKTVTAYSTVDNIFVFYQQPNHKKGSLTATDTINASFQWSKFDTISKTFISLGSAENNVLSSTLNNLDEGGYKVIISDTVGKDTSFVAWVAFDSLHIKINQDAQGFVPYFNSTCEYFDLIVIDSLDLKNPQPVNYKYFDPTGKKIYEFPNSFSFEWFKENESTAFAISTLARQRVSGENIPTENTDYSVNVSDKFGLGQTNKVTYKSIVPKADFETFADTINGENSAPLKVTFTNNSINAEKYTWYMGDGDTLEVTTPDPHTYYVPKTYKVTLIAESKEKCTREDTTSIIVEPPKLKVPNVFVPGLGNFKFKAISLRYYKMIIFTRWGKKVYEEEAYDKSKQVGWNGKIGNNYAAEGIYYYIIEVRHWDPNPSAENDGIRNKGRYDGFFYLFRAGY